MHVALVPYVGAGTEQDPFRPGVEGDWSAIDLRPDATRRAGWAVVGTPAPLPAPALTIADDLDATLMATRRRSIGNALGVTVDATTVRALLPELLLTHARTDGSRWRPLEAFRRGGRLLRQIWLGELVWEQEILGGPGAVLSESFNQPDSTVLGPNLAWTERLEDWSTAGNRVVPGANTAIAMPRTALDTGDQRATLRITARDTAGGALGTVVRLSASAITDYHGRRANGRWQLFKFVSGTATLLGEFLESFAEPYVLETRAVGSSVSVLADGATKIGPVTDTTNASSDTALRHVGVQAFNGQAAWRGDDFFAEDIDTTRPSVTINQAAGQADPTGTSPVNFTVTFSEPVNGFTGADVALSGTAGPTTATVTGSGASYTVAVSGMTSHGTVIASIPANVAQDAAGNLNTASTSTDNVVTYDPRPAVLAVRVDFDGDPLTPSGTDSDVSDRASDLTIVTGRQQELDAFQPGTLRGPLDNSDRRFDPLHTAGPHFGKLRPRKRVRAQVSNYGVLHDLATVFIDGWPQSYTLGEVAWSELSGTDGFALLASAELPGSVYEIEVAKDNPSAWWRLGETEGIRAVDSSPNRYDGSYVGGATFNTREGLIFGDADNAIEFDGVSHSVGMLGPARRPLPLTVEFWLKTDKPAPAGGPSAVIWAQGDGRETRITMRTTGAVAALQRNGDGSEATAVTPSSLADNQRHHVVVRLTEFGPVEILVDGVSVATSSNIVTGLPQEGPVFLGHAGTLARFAGILDEVAMYHHNGMDNARVAAHYVAGTKPWDGDTTGARVNRILDVIGWPAGERDVDTGQSILGPPRLGRQKALAYLQSIEATEQGALHMLGDNSVRFRERHARFVDPRMTTPQATLSDEDAPGALHYEGDIRLELDETLVYNEVTVRWDGGEVTVKDEASIAQYGRKSHSVDTIASTVDDARGIGEWVLDHHRQPTTRVSTVTVNPGVDPALWPTALERLIGDRIALRRHPQAIGDPITIEAHIEGKEHAIGTDTWRTTFPLATTTTKQYGLVGSAVVGTSAVAF
jgi:hypothetical protein